MSDCGLRCFTERKTYCKDLHKWGRNLLYMIGLECVAKHMTAPRVWTHISPFLHAAGAPAESAADWSPDGFCPVCTGHRFSAMHAQNSEADAEKAKEDDERATQVGTVESAPKGELKLNFDFLYNGNDSSKQPLHDPFFGAANMFAQPPFYNSPMHFLSYNPTAYLQQLMQWSLAVNPALFGPTYPAALNVGAPRLNHHTSHTPREAPADAADEPLDLSVGKAKAAGPSSSTKLSAFEPPSLNAFGHSTAPAAFADKLRCGSATATVLTDPPIVKRNYSQLDLDAAVRDIRSGRLGTRRASVVYNIPRSTLRNKIYKLEAAEESAEAAASPLKQPRTEAPLNDSATNSPSSESGAQSVSDSVPDSPSLAVTPLPAAPAGWDLSAPATTTAAAAGKADDGADSDAWKKARPKRGQYRKYDKNALDEAVRSVRRGEMSVHRAGSYFGVPHSTLEYKVKERNLIRLKKKEQRLTPAAPSATPKTPRKDERQRRSRRKAPITAPPAADTDGADVPAEPAPPVWPNAFPAAPSLRAPNHYPFFASDMMRKLQAEANGMDA